MNTNEQVNSIEDNFIKNCKNISPYINPNIFLQRYSKFSKEYLAFFEQDLLKIYNAIHSKFPNSEFAIKGRTKSKYSFCNKIVQKLEQYFNFDNEKNPIKKQKLIDKLENILKNFDESKELITILNLPSMNSNDKLETIYKALQEPKKQNKLSFFLGLCDDIYAYRLIIRSSGYDIQNSYFDNDTLYIKDSNGKIKTVEPSLKIDNPKEITTIMNIVSSSNCVTSTRFFKDINGQREEINLNNIEKNDDKSIKINEDGSLTLLRDAIEMPNGDIVNVTSKNIKNIDGMAYIKLPSGELKNIDGLVLKKYDEPHLIERLYDILQYSNDVLINFNNDPKQKMELAPKRHKDYIKNPKPTGYSSIHDTFLKSFYNPKKEKFTTAYSEEMQARTYTMEADMKNPKSNLAHTNYKSTENDLLALAKNPNIDLEDLCPNYIMVTSFKDKNNEINATTWKPSLKYCIEHSLGVKYEDIIMERTANEEDFGVPDDYDNELE